jgi:hypothetical protein
MAVAVLIDDDTMFEFDERAALIDQVQKFIYPCGNKRCPRAPRETRPVYHIIDDAEVPPGYSTYGYARFIIEAAQKEINK